jgi:hypothetical protein
MVKTQPTARSNRPGQIEGDSLGPMTVDRAERQLLSRAYHRAGERFGSDRFAPNACQNRRDK